MFAHITPTAAEIDKDLPGDDIVSPADVTMDRAFSLPARPELVWPWFVQLGKNRAGWYLPQWVERFFRAGKRGLRYIEPKLQDLAVGKVIDDWGGKDASFEVALLESSTHIVHKSTRGRSHISWGIYLASEGATGTRVQLRLRIAPVKRRRLAKVGGGFIDALTVAGLAVGLRERLQKGKV